jgi:hypothetical protein
VGFFRDLARDIRQSRRSAELNEMRQYIDTLIVRVKAKYVISFTLIAPALFETGFTVYLNFVGLQKAKDFYDVCLEWIDTNSNIPASAIMGVEPFPSDKEIEGLTMAFGRFANLFIEKGFSNDDIAQVFTALGYDIASRHVDPLYGAFILRRLRSRACKILDHQKGP